MLIVTLTEKAFSMKKIKKFSSYPLYKLKT